MSQTPPRRLSTGGQPPIRIREHYVVEKAPSHDGTPCFTAWIREENAQIAFSPGWSISDYTVGDKRPQWSIQIYDTTPGSDNPDHLKTLAETLQRETWEEREGSGRGLRDRIDVWGMPLATDASDEERIAKCKAHVLAEIASRNITRRADFHISRLSSGEVWQRAIVIIAQPRELWDEDDGGFLAVFWDPFPSFLAQCARKYEYRDDPPEPRTSWVYRFSRAELGREFGELRSSLSQSENEQSDELSGSTFQELAFHLQTPEHDYETRPL